MTSGTPQIYGLAILIDEVVGEEREGGGRGILFRDAGGITAADVNTMAKHGRGWVGAVLGGGGVFALDLSRVRVATPRIARPRFLASVESLACSETGISAQERATTLAALGSWSSTSASFQSPGHVFPAIPAENRIDWQLSDIAYHFCGIREGALATAWCDVLDDRGNVASARWCRALAAGLGLAVVTTRDALAVIDGYRAEPALRVA